MKKWFCVLCFLLVMTMLPVFAEMQEEQSAAQSINHLNNENCYAINLEVDGGYLRLLIPIGFQLQEYELSDIEEYPFSYVFIDKDTNAQFIVYSSIPSEKDQGIGLRKLYDKSNKYIVFEDVGIGAHTYIIYTKEQATYDYGFFVRADNGYSYQFQYILPYDTIQNDIPTEALSILSTLEIHDFSER